MAERKNKSVWRWVLGSLTVIAGVIIAGWFFVKKDLSKPNQSANGKGSILKPLIQDKLKDMVVAASDSLYHITFSKFDMNIDSGYAVMSDVKLIPDSAVYKRLVAAHKAPDNLMRMSAQDLRLTKFGFINTSDGKRFGINRVVVVRPKVVISNHRLAASQPDQDKQSLLYKTFMSFFKRMHIEHMSVRNADLTYINKNEAFVKSDYLHNLNIDVTGFTTSPSAKGDSGSSWTNVSVAKFRLATPDSTYYLDIKNAQLLPAAHRLTMEHASLLPRQSKAQFQKTYGFARDRIHLEYDDINLSGIDIERFMRKQQVYVYNYNVGKSWVEVYTNYNYPLKNKLRRNAYFHRQLQTLAFDITIKQMNISHGDVYFRILASKSDKVATLALTDSKTIIYNITNNIAEKQKNPYLTVVSQALLMNAGLMKTRYVFNLTDKTGGYTVSSTIGTMDGRAFNDLSMPLGLMEVKEGRINRSETFMQVNEYHATGNTNMYYSGVKVALLKKDKDDGDLKRRGFLSFVTNMVMPNDNPRKNGDFKKGPINVIRDPHDSFFGFLWKGMADGMSSAMMGMHQHGKKPDQNIIQKVGKLISGPGRKADNVKNGKNQDKKD
ncbi:hypothetical protein [Mucilaginibacter lacusdianchii]|uniref:hypothetical protein n=1 Tax=Mucilaginibacter lacusdianchii TaxID=2684211 RepID=UPI00131BD7F6|nr:hypothetical protein [Mucilaginibacter sp. JXJ CY 39]